MYKKQDNPRIRVRDLNSLLQPKARQVDDAPVLNQLPDEPQESLLQDLPQLDNDLQSILDDCSTVYTNDVQIEGEFPPSNMETSRIAFSEPQIIGPASTRATSFQNDTQILDCCNPMSGTFPIITNCRSLAQDVFSDERDVLANVVQKKQNVTTNKTTPIYDNPPNPPQKIFSEELPAGTPIVVRDTDTGAERTFITTKENTPSANVLRVKRDKTFMGNITNVHSLQGPISQKDNFHFPDNQNNGRAESLRQFRPNLQSNQPNNISSSIAQTPTLRTYVGSTAVQNQTKEKLIPSFQTTTPSTYNTGNQNRSLLQKNACAIRSASTVYGTGFKSTDNQAQEKNLTGSALPRKVVVMSNQNNAQQKNIKSLGPVKYCVIPAKNVQTFSPQIGIQNKEQDSSKNASQKEAQKGPEKVKMPALKRIAPQRKSTDSQTNVSKSVLYAPLKEPIYSNASVIQKNPSVNQNAQNHVQQQRVVYTNIPSDIPQNFYPSVQNDVQNIQPQNNVYSEQTRTVYADIQQHQGGFYVTSPPIRQQTILIQNPMMQQTSSVYTNVSNTVTVQPQQTSYILSDGEQNLSQNILITPASQNHPTMQQSSYPSLSTTVVLQNNPGQPLNVMPPNIVNVNIQPQPLSGSVERAAPPPYEVTDSNPRLSFPNPSPYTNFGVFNKETETIKKSVTRDILPNLVKVTETIIPSAPGNWEQIGVQAYANSKNVQIKSASLRNVQPDNKKNNVDVETNIDAFRVTRQQNFSKLAYQLVQNDSAKLKIIKEKEENLRVERKEALKKTHDMLPSSHEAPGFPPPKRKKNASVFEEREENLVTLTKSDIQSSKAVVDILDNSKAEKCQAGSDKVDDTLSNESEVKKETDQNIVYLSKHVFMAYDVLLCECHVVLKRLKLKESSIKPTTGEEKEKSAETREDGKIALNSRQRTLRKYGRNVTLCPTCQETNESKNFWMNVAQPSVLQCNLCVTKSYIASLTSADETLRQQLIQALLCESSSDDEMSLVKTEETSPRNDTIALPKRRRVRRLASDSDSS